MATYLLDTNIIIDLLNGKGNRNRFLLELTEQQGHTLACCAINVAEVYAGMRPKEEARTSALLRSLLLLPISFQVAELAGFLKRDYAGVTLSLADTLIAAVAIHNRLTLITTSKTFQWRNCLFCPHRTESPEPSAARRYNRLCGLTGPAHADFFRSHRP